MDIARNILVLAALLGLCLMGGCKKEGESAESLPSNSRTSGTFEIPARTVIQPRKSEVAIPTSEEGFRKAAAEKRAEAQAFGKKIEKKIKQHGYTPTDGDKATMRELMDAAKALEKMARRLGKKASATATGSATYDRKSGSGTGSATGTATGRYYK